MQSLALINKLLEEIALRHDISNLQLGANGTVAVKLRNGVELIIEFVHRDDRVFVYTVIGTLTNMFEERGRVCELMLEMNCLGRDTLHGALSLDGSGDILYQIGLPVADLTVDRLDHALQDLLAQRPSLMDRIKKPDSSVRPVSSSRGASTSKLGRLARLFPSRSEA